MSAPSLLEAVCRALVDPARSGVHPLVDPRDVATVADAGEAVGAAVVRIDLAGVDGKAALLARLAAALRLPAWFGHNWDALADCLVDMSWWPAPGYLLIVEHAGPLRDLHPDEHDALVAILRDSAEAWADQGIAFNALIVG